MFTAPTRFTVWHDPKLFKWTANWNFVEPNEVWEYSMPTICSEFLFKCGIRCTEKMVKKRLECPCQSVDCATGYGYLKKIIDFAWLSMAPRVKVKVEINLSWANIRFCLGANYFVCMLIQVSADRPAVLHHAYRVIGKWTGICMLFWEVSVFCYQVCFFILLIKQTKTPLTIVLSV